MINIICVGKIKENYLTELIKDYSKRINKYHKLNIIELKDKIIKGGNTAVETILPGASSANKEEALSALILLGFTKAAVEKVLTSILKENPNYSLEELIKLSLKRL